MPTPQKKSQPSPEKFFQTVTAYQHSAAIKAAIELNIFTIIGKRERATAAQIAQESGAAERGIRILCDYLTVDGFLTKNSDKKDSANNNYSLTADSATFLDQRSPAYMGSVVDFLQSDYLEASFKVLTESVRKGGTAKSKEGSIAPEHPQWVTFARAMAPLMYPAAEMIAKLLTPRLPKNAKVLDIAAGHGIFGATLAQKHPTVRIVALDWKPVLEVAAEDAKKLGVADRHSLLPGSCFEVDYGARYDAVLLTNLLHHFDYDTCVSMLKKSHAALEPGGALVILEAVPNDDRISPPDQAQFSLIMLADTPAGDAYTDSDFRRMCKSAGFKNYEAHPFVGVPQTVIVAEK